MACLCLSSLMIEALSNTVVSNNALLFLFQTKLLNLFGDRLGLQGACYEQKALLRNYNEAAAT